ncbi:alpha/beta fold hydrolase [Shewanella sp. SP1S1-7]|uniref:alpha/beta fold hydrolase n=1 Tax=Shewanella sp. SP1S1-7 TaxID=3063536 RepID=UPI00288DBDBF|nr:alpha/beta fold hydrolase [Shewanella sp. SP1S1-7]MDT3337857.1 alpha/beta fold hydrolase [Shewanella sp. SP1S1-7]
MSQAKATFSTEHDLNTSEQQAFWQSVVQDTLITADGITLAYMMVKHPQAHTAIVLSNGRVESYLKYQELVFDLYQQGYSVYAIDHRGQGLSDRMTINTHMGHVRRFNDYIDDFALFMQKKVLPQNDKQLMLLGHSMGGAIGTLYLKQHPDIFTAAAFSAPMYGIKLPMPKAFVRWLASKLDTTLNGGEPNYVLGGQNYKPVPFKGNELTHCQSRYQAYRDLYDAAPKLQLGSPTNRWLTESLDAADTCVLATAQIRTPILILQASEDKIVDNAAQNLAVSTHCQLKVIAGAAHEIFMEKDAYRNQALNYALDFFKRFAIKDEDKQAG